MLPEKPWHLLAEEEALGYWESCSSSGLRGEVVPGRRAEFGPNLLPQARPRASLAIFFDQFKSLPVALLGASAGLSVLTGGLADGAIILGVVFTNAIIGYATERWAEKTIAGLSRAVRPKAKVLRDGVELEIPGEELVPGDLIQLERGTYVPADGRLLWTHELTVDESSLTGESVPVVKRPAALSQAEVPLGSRVNMVYRGTVVTGGAARALVVETGAATEVGRIQRLLAEVRPPETPLQRQLRELGGQLAVVSMAICGGVFGLGLARGRSVMPMLKTAVSLAVAAVPEGLPTVATTTLALGMRKLREQNVLVRKLNAVETLGALQVVCLDKTGTVTQNRMELVSAFVGMERFEVSAGVIYRHGQVVDPLMVGELVRLFEMASLCSEVELDSSNGEVTLRGTPTESALVRAAVEIGVDVQALRRRYPLKHKRLRSEQRNFMDTRHTDAVGGESLLVVKGTPVEVLPLCTHRLEDGVVRALEERDIERIRLENERMAGRALRVLAVAYSEETGVPEQSRNLIWIGLAGIADPPRAQMAELMGEFHRAGIHTVMITGDQSATATAIAKEIELNPSEQLQSLDAARLETMAPEVLSSLAKRVDIFSRVSPSQKLQIVKALQASGQVVAMTGDGVNDGPALRAADIGIAMGRSGSEVAQEVAAIVISDDELTTIIASIEQGRTIYDDIKKAVHFILSSNTSEILMTVTATAAGLGQPLNPMQLLWINLVSDVFPELALGVEPPEPEVLHRPPRDPLAPMFTREDLRKVFFEGSLITSSAMSAYLWGLLRYGSGVHASTVGFTSLTTAQLLHAITCRSEPHSIFDEVPLPRNPYIPLSVGGGLAVTGLATLVPSLRRVLGVTRLGFVDWLIAGVTAVAPLFTNEILKVVRRNRTQGHENPPGVDLVGRSDRLEHHPRRQDDGQQK